MSVEYIILSKDSADKLSACVKEYIGNGFRPTGGVALSVEVDPREDEDGFHDSYYTWAQAMIREGRDE